MEKIDIAIIGAGILGLQLAKKILDENPDALVCVFEKEAYVGEHSSGRNSGVIHSGLYYPNQSLKHLLCKSGNKAWSRLASSLSIPIQYCGKYVIAKNPEEDEVLKHYLQLAKINEVGCAYLSQKGIPEDLAESFHCTSALFIPSTGIIDQSEALIQLRNYIQGSGGILLFSHKLEVIKNQNSGFYLGFSNGLEVFAGIVINCAGLEAVTLRKKLGLFDVEDYWVKGNYLKSKKRNTFKSLVYPVPLKNLKGLGVHLTFDLHNTLKFGPNTEEVSKIDYSISDTTVEEMKKNVLGFIKNGNPEDLSADYAGIRPKIKYKNQLYPDFWIQSPIDHYIELLGIESPGFTASPSIAEYVYERFLAP